MNVSVAFSFSLNDSPLYFFESRDGYFVLKDEEDNKIFVPLVLYNDESVENMREALHRMIDKSFGTLIEESNNE